MRAQARSSSSGDLLPRRTRLERHSVVVPRWRFTQNLYQQESTNSGRPLALPWANTWNVRTSVELELDSLGSPSVTCSALAMTSSDDKELYGLRLSCGVGLVDGTRRRPKPLPRPRSRPHPRPRIAGRLRLRLHWGGVGLRGLGLRLTYSGVGLRGFWQLAVDTHARRTLRCARRRRCIDIFIRNAPCEFNYIIYPIFV